MAAISIDRAKSANRRSNCKPACPSRSRELSNGWLPSEILTSLSWEISAIGLYAQMHSCARHFARAPCPRACQPWASILRPWHAHGGEFTRQVGYHSRNAQRRLFEVRADRRSRWGRLTIPPLTPARLSPPILFFRHLRPWILVEGGHARSWKDDCRSLAILSNHGLASIVPGRLSRATDSDAEEARGVISHRGEVKNNPSSDPSIHPLIHKIRPPTNHKPPPPPSHQNTYPCTHPFPSLRFPLTPPTCPPILPAYRPSLLPSSPPWGFDSQSRPPLSTIPRLA